MKRPDSSLLIDKSETVISIDGLYKSFDDLKVLNGIDLKLHRCENLTVLGRSGSGKSVIADLLQLIFVAKKEFWESGSKD